MVVIKMIDSVEYVVVFVEEEVKIENVEGGEGEVKIEGIEGGEGEIKFESIEGGEREFSFEGILLLISEIVVINEIEIGIDYFKYEIDDELSWVMYRLMDSFF